MTGARGATIVPLAMKILVIGSGGREHALAWKLRQSPLVKHIWCAPGNGGISQDAECVAADVNDVSGLAALAERLGADLTVVGPEQPLVLGIADEFARKGLAIAGPTKAAAQLEGSKIFAKEFMHRHDIPTAPVYGTYDSPGDAYSALCAVDWPVAIKADGLCGGKGVMVAPDPDSATAFIERVMDRRELGAGGGRLLMEEALEGEELSYIVLTDGEHILPLAPTRDHKRVFDGNKGPNTGGMGAYSSDDLLSADLENQILGNIVRPAIEGLAQEGIRYKGFLYFGLMLKAGEPKVLEFNCRLGDPEAQALVIRMGFDLAAALEAVTLGKLAQIKAAWKPGAAACVVMASGGYPGEFQKGLQIQGLPPATESGQAVVFHAGTMREGANYYTSSGRVLDVTASGQTLDAAIQSAYACISKISFDGAHYRRDIGAGAVKASGAASD